MTDKDCNCDCCNISYEDIEDDYDIERLEDIIEICQFLIKTKKHRIQKRENMEKLFSETSEKEKEDNDSYTHTITNTKVHPYYMYKYSYPWHIYPRYKKHVHRIPYWDQVWF